MPQLIAIALIGAGAYAGYKYLSRQMQRMAEPPGSPDEPSASGGQQHRGELVWDAEAGVYRPREG
jgi:hypothetical protein